MGVESLTYQESQQIEFAGNTFIDVPFILMYEKTPLVEAIRSVEFPTQHSLKIQIFHRADGVYVGCVKGARLFLTPDGKKLGYRLRTPVGATVCEYNKQTIFELRRTQAAAIALTAELTTADGMFVSVDGSASALCDNTGLQIGSIYMQGNLIQGCEIGVHFDRSGVCRIGAGLAGIGMTRDDVLTVTKRLEQAAHETR